MKSGKVEESLVHMMANVVRGRSPGIAEVAASLCGLLWCARLLLSAGHFATVFCLFKCNGVLTQNLPSLDAACLVLICCCCAWRIAHRRSRSELGWC